MWELLWPRGACLLLGYVLGSVMTAEPVARITVGKSIREIGNGNPGFANVLLHLGKPAGAAVLLGDVVKTAAACWLCAVLFPSLKGIAILYAGLGAVLGHDFPPLARGGKGVTVTSGLEEGDLVIVKGYQKVSGGMRVDVQMVDTEEIF